MSDKHQKHTEKNQQKEAKSRQTSKKRQKYLWFIFWIIFLLIQIGLFYLPSLKNYRSRANDKIEEVQKLLPTLRNKIEDVERLISKEQLYISTLQSQLDRSLGQEQREQIARKIEDRINILSPLQEQYDTLTAAEKLALPQTLLSNQHKKESSIYSSDLLLHARECVERTQASADHIDDLTMRFITFILTAGTLFFATFGIWSWRKKEEFKEDYKSNLKDIRNQGKAQMLEIKKEIDLELRYSKYLAHMLAGDVLCERNIKNKALEKYQVAISILDTALLEFNEKNYLHEKTILLNKIGDIHLEYGQFTQADDNYKKSRETAERLITIDPNNLTWQRDLVFSLKKRGKVALQQGNMDSSDALYKDVLNIIEELLNNHKLKNLNQLYHDKNTILLQLGKINKERGSLLEAEEYFQKSLRIAEELLASDPTNLKWQRDRMLSLWEISKISKEKGELSKAYNECEKVLQMARELLSKDFENTERLFDLSEILGTMTSIIKDKDSLSSAIKHCKERKNIVEYLAKKDPYNTQWQKERSFALGSLGLLLSNKIGSTEAAEKLLRSSIAVIEHLSEKDKNKALWQRELSTSLHNLASFLHNKTDSNNNQEAEGLYRKSWAIDEKLVTKDENNSLYQNNLSISLNNLATLLKKRNKDNDMQEAEVLFQRALAIDEKLATKDENNSHFQSELGTSLNNLAKLLSERNKDNDIQEAEEIFRRALDITEKLVTKDENNSPYQNNLGASLNNLAKLLSERNKDNDMQEAEELFRRSLDIGEKLATKDENNSLFQSNLSASLNNLAKLLSERNKDNDMQEAEELFRRALAIDEKLATKDENNSLFQSNLKLGLNNLANLLKKRNKDNDIQEAEKLLQRAIEIHK